MRSSWRSRLSESATVRGIERFFFAEEIPYGMALMRMALCFVLLCDAAFRWSYAREIYSSDGAPSPLAECYGVLNYLPEFPASVIIPLHTALVCLLVSGCVGWCTKFSLWGATVLYFYFGMMDSLSTVNKYAVIANHGLLLLALSQAGTVWSVDAWLRGTWRRNPLSSAGVATWKPAPVWPQRLVQFFVGTVYLGAAMTKMHTPEYFSGDQTFYWMITNVTAAHPLGKYISQYPAVAVISSYVAIIWEVLFLFCCWSGWGRIVMLTAGVIFHFSTWALLGLTVFPMVMYAIYLAFLTEADVQWMGALYRRLRRKVGHGVRPTEAIARALKCERWRLPQVSPARSAAAFCFLLGMAMFVGTEIEYRGDYYGMRRPEGPYSLRELNEDEIQTMLTPEEPLREEDKFLAFDLGNVFVGGRLVKRVNQYRQEERFFCEVSLNPPHEDMWLELNLHDSEQRLLERVGQIVPREKFRAHWNYVLSQAYEPGEYTLVLRSRNKDIMRRRFTLTPALGAPVAN